MTLVITALAPDVIVLAADSAIQIEYGATTPTPLSGQQKLFSWRNGRIGGALYGRFLLHVKGVPFIEWITREIDDSIGSGGGGRIDMGGPFKGLADQLTKIIDPTWPDAVGFHIAGWFEWDDFAGVKIPSMLRLNRTGPRQSYTLTRFPEDRILAEFQKRLRGGDHSKYPVYFTTDGIAKVGANQKAFHDVLSKILGADLNFGNAGAVGEYCRKVISTVAGFYQFTSLGQVVSEPAHVMIIPRDTVHSITIRY